MPNERVIVVGAGGIAGAWFPPLMDEGVEVVAVVDLNIQAARERIAHFALQAKAYDNLEAALAECKADFLLDLTSPQSHCQVTCAALRAGLHVLGEKPMAVSMEEARRMVATAHETDRLYMVNQSRRWEAGHKAMADAVASGIIGKLTTVNCDFYLGVHFGGFRDTMESPLVLDMAIHHFDMARMISGRDPVGVYADEFNPAGSWYQGDAAATCIFDMTDGVKFVYRGSWCAEGCSTPWSGDWRLVGERGTVLYHNEQLLCEVVEREEGFRFAYRAVELPRPAMPHETMHGALCEMLDFLRGGPRPQTECRDNIHSLAMVFGAKESADRRAYVTLDSWPTA